jgi:predicted RNA polymerase sigma factor
LTTPTIGCETIDMKFDATATIRDQINDLYRSESRRVCASLVRLRNDFAFVDDALHEAYAAPVDIWQRKGGLEIVDRVLSRGEPCNYQFAHSVRGELLPQVGKTSVALIAFQQSLELA